MNTEKSKMCRHIAPILQIVVNDNGSQKEIEAVESHLATCAKCRAEYDRWKHTAQLTAAWKLAEVPESRRDWNDLHARFAAQQPQTLRPAFPLRLGWGGLVGATAVAAFCFLLPHPETEGDRGTGGQGEKFLVKQNVPVAQTPPMEQLALVSGTKTYPSQKQTSYGRTFAAASPPLKMKRDKPFLTLAKSQELTLPSPREERAKRGEGSGVREKRVIAQTKPEVSRPLPLNIDGETSTPDTAQEYVLGAVPSGQGSGIQLTPASYSSSEKTAW